MAVLCIFLVAALVSVGCSLREQQAPVSVQANGFRFEYPSDMTKDSVWFASLSSAGGDCICHAVASSEGREWTFLFEENYRYKDDVLSGVSVKAINASDIDYDELVQDSAGGSVIVELVRRLGIADTERMQLPLEQASATAGDSRIMVSSTSDRLMVGTSDVQQKSWIIVSPETERIYSLVCQFRPENASSVVTICEKMLSSFVLDG